MYVGDVVISNHSPRVHVATLDDATGEVYLHIRRAMADISYSTSLSDEELIECMIRDDLRELQRYVDAIKENIAAKARARLTEQFNRERRKG